MGATIQPARFIPPPPADMMAALGDIERVMHAPEQIPALIKNGLIHAQFETIHPFLDGNGRMGRLLITFYLCQQGILRKPLLYLSHFFKLNKTECYEQLQRVRDEGDWESWLKFFLHGVHDVAQQATATVHNIVSLRERHRALVARATSHGAGTATQLLSILAGIFFLLMGIGAAGLGTLGHLRPDRFPSPRNIGDPLQPVTPAEWGFWLMGWALVALGFVCLGLTVLRYYPGPYVVVPASAPLIDQIIRDLFFVGFLGGLALLLTGSVVRQLRNKRKERRSSPVPQGWGWALNRLAYRLFTTRWFWLAWRLFVGGVGVPVLFAGPLHFHPITGMVARYSYADRALQLVGDRTRYFFLPDNFPSALPARIPSGTVVRIWIDGNDPDLDALQIIGPGGTPEATYMDIFFAHPARQEQETFIAGVVSTTLGAVSVLGSLCWPPLTRRHRLATWPLP